MALTAFDTSGKVFIRTLLRENPTPSTVDQLRVLLHVAGAAYSVEDVASEIGVQLPPALHVFATEVVKPRRVPPRKVRTPWH
jgi:hypothetical protein